MLEALTRFFQDITHKAESVGYEFSIAVTDGGNQVLIYITQMYSGLPSIYVTPKKSWEGQWTFNVVVSFPEINLSNYLEQEGSTLEDVVDSWQDAVALADEIESVKFDPDDWA